MTGEDAFIKELDEIIDSMVKNNMEISEIRKRVLELKARDLKKAGPLLFEALAGSVKLNEDLSGLFIKFALAVKRYLEENKSITTLITT